MRRIVLVLLLCANGVAHAADDEATIVGGIDFGFKKLRLDFDRADNAFTPSFVTINPNLGLSYGAFYASLSYDKSISAETTSGVDSALGLATATDYSRADTAFTLGYRIGPSFSLFLGYTQGVSKMNVKGSRFVVTDPTTNPPEIEIFLNVQDIEFKETGPFAGAAFNTTFANQHTLGLSLGYAVLEGRLSRHSQPAAPLDFEVEGDTKGFSYGLMLSGPLTGSLGYRLALKSTRYETDDLNGLTESYNSFYIGVMNFF
jgi:hypothetical protein